MAGSGKASAASYEGLARIYDSLAYDMPADEWAAYLLSLWDGGAARVLEYGCGTGRITEHLIRAGHRVIALDRSAQMLTQAAGKLRPFGGAYQLVEAAMTDFVMDHPADLAICACDVVNYLTTREDLMHFFARAASNLKQGGLFLFDISSRYKLESVLGDQFYYDDGDCETLFWQNQYDAVSRLLTMDLTVFRLVGDAYERTDERHIQRAWSGGEITDALASAGFSQVQTWAFGTRNAPSEDTQRVQFAAAK